MFIKHIICSRILSLDNNLDIESLELCETAISSTLKAFFKLLPDPLIPDTVAAMMPVINCKCNVCREVESN